MKKLLILALTLIMLTSLFTSCANLSSTKSITPKKFYSDYTPDPAFSWKNAEKVQSLSGKTILSQTYSSSYSTLIPFKTEGDRKTDISIYNLLTNTQVHSFTVDNADYYHVDTFSVYGNYFFTVIHGVAHADETEFTTTLYDAKGTQIAKADGIVLRTNSYNPFYSYSAMNLEIENDSSAPIGI